MAHITGGCPSWVCATVLGCKPAGTFAAGAVVAYATTGDRFRPRLVLDRLVVIGRLARRNRRMGASVACLAGQITVARCRPVEGGSRVHLGYSGVTGYTFRLRLPRHALTRGNGAGHRGKAPVTGYAVAVGCCVCEASAALCRRARMAVITGCCGVDGRVESMNRLRKVNPRTSRPCRPEDRAAVAVRAEHGLVAREIRPMRSIVLCQDVLESIRPVAPVAVDLVRGRDRRTGLRNRGARAVLDGDLNGLIGIPHVAVVNRGNRNPIGREIAGLGDHIARKRIVDCRIDEIQAEVSGQAHAEELQHEIPELSIGTLAVRVCVVD